MARSTNNAARPAGDNQLEEKRHTLVGKRDTLERERTRLAEDALVNPVAREKRDQLIAELAEVETELRAINAAMAARQPDQPDSTASYLQWAGSGGGGRLLTGSDRSPPASWRGTRR